MKRQIFTLTGAGLGVLFATFASPQAQQAPPSVTFQVEINYVDVDAIVTDELGNPVSGLTRDDFEIFEDGRPQQIDMFSYVEIPVELDNRLLFLGKPVVTDVRSNRRAFDGRVYVIVLDDLDVSPLRTGLVKKAAREFIERHLGVNDVAAVVYTSGRTDATQEFTGNHPLLLAAVDKFLGRSLRPAAIETLEAHYHQQLTKDFGVDDAEIAPNPSPGVSNSLAPVKLTDFERENRTLMVLDTLKNLGEFLSGVRGRRKAVLLFSEGLETPMNEIFGTHTATDVVGAVKDAITAAARSNVNFFAVDPRGLIGFTTEYIELAGSGAPDVAMGGFGSLNAQQGLLAEIRLSQDSLRTLAEQTGGFAAVNRNALGTVFDRIVDANSRYYLLGYYPPTHLRDGKFHTIDVRVKRPGLNVSARKGYASPRGRTPEEKRRDDAARRARQSKRGDAANMSAELREALNDSPMQQGNLTFSVQAAPFKSMQKEASVALALEFDGDRLQFEPPQSSAVYANKVEISFFSINEQGKALKGTRTDLNLALRPETYQRVKANGLRVNPRISLAPGRYQVRLGGRESATGSVGSVFYDLEVPDFRKEPLMLSGLLLTAASANDAMTALPDFASARLLASPATSRRTFPRSDTLTVFAEIYDNLPAKQAHQIDAGVLLISERGQEVFAARDVLANGGSEAKPWSAYSLLRDIPLGSLSAGRYLLRVEARLRGAKEAAPIARETLIQVLDP